MQPPCGKSSVKKKLEASQKTAYEINLRQCALLLTVVIWYAARLSAMAFAPVVSFHREIKN